VRFRDHRLATLVLGAAVMAATAWAVLAGGWVTGAGAAVAVSLTGFVGAVVLVQFRTPRWAAVIASPAMLALALVPFTVGGMPPDGDGGVVHIARRYLDAATGGLFASGDWPFLVALCALLGGCAYWLGWWVLRERRGVVATLPCYTVLAINALNAPSVGRVAVPEIVSAGLCLLLVAEVHRDRLVARWRASTLTVLPGVRSRFTVSMAIATVAVVGLSVVLPPVTSRDISSVLFSARVRPPQVGAETTGRPAPSGAPVAFSRSTRPGGPLVSRPRPALVYSTDAPAPAYLRLVNDTVFDAGNWFPTGPPVGRPQPSGGPATEATAITPGNGAINRDRDPAHGGVSPAQRPTHTSVTLSAVGEDAGFVPFTGDPEAADKTGRAIELGLAPARGSALLTVDQVTPVTPPAPGAQIESIGMVPTAPEDKLRAAGTDYPGFTGALRSTGGDTSPGAAAIRGMALSWVRGETNPYDQARAIERHLRDPRVFTYDLSPPAAPDATWPIVYFLTTSHRGYCQYFASSMGAMLRSLDIPTRLVNGYGPGSVSDSGTPGVTLHAVTTSDAHTWVEAYFPHFGWIPFEPTPPSSLGDYQPSPRTPSGAPPAAGSNPTPAPTPSPTPNVSPPTPAPANNPASSPPPPPSGRPPAWVVAVPLVTALVVVVAVGWWMRPASLGGLRRRLLVAGRLTGVRRRPSETDAGYASRLASGLAVGRPTLGGTIMEIAAVSGKAQFSAGGLHAQDREGWLRNWRTGRRELLTAVAGFTVRRVRPRR